MLTYPKTMPSTRVIAEAETVLGRENPAAAAGLLVPCGRGLSTARQVSLLVKTDLDLLLVSSGLGVRPSTIRKIQYGRPISEAVERKIETALRGGALSKPATRTLSKLERLFAVHQLYEEERSLEGVGRRIGLTRERVRQLLVKGSKIGLFHYQSLYRSRPLISKEKILSDYKKLQRLYRVAGSNGISTLYLKTLLAMHGITRKDLEGVRREGRMRECIEEYAGFAARLGHLPTTTELQKGSGSYLSQKITKLWGSFQAFRNTLVIPEAGAGQEAFARNSALEPVRIKVRPDKFLQRSRAADR